MQDYNIEEHLSIEIQRFVSQFPKTESFRIEMNKGDFRSFFYNAPKDTAQADSEMFGRRFHFLVSQDKKPGKFSISAIEDGEIPEFN